jgi:sulfatase maturation enzyme AslB (radical SAM superfamily)
MTMSEGEPGEKPNRRAQLEIMKFFSAKAKENKMRFIAFSIGETPDDSMQCYTTPVEELGELLGEALAVAVKKAYDRIGGDAPLEHILDQHILQMKAVARNRLLNADKRKRVSDIMEGLKQNPDAWKP